MDILARRPNVLMQRARGNLYSNIRSEPLIYVTTDYIFQGWLEVSIDKQSGKSSWLKKSVIKQWKSKFAVLVRPLEESDNVTLELFDKEENWNSQTVKKSLDLYPRYKVAKRGEFKGREFVFEVTNGDETWYLAADSQRAMDLWVIQIQMQTKLSRSISGRIFSVMPCKTRPLQRIGARDQRCLLHFTRWGLTLALQDSRSILALWPLSTIRNYECSGSGNFTFESGRRAPMGTGHYSFSTMHGDDEVMFNVIDAFVNARLNARAEIGKNKKKEEETTDEEVLATYDKLHSCAVGILSHDGYLGGEDYALIGPPQPNDPPLLSDRPPPYDHLATAGLIRTRSQSSAASVEDIGSCPPDSRNSSFSGTTSQSYDQLNRTRSWGTKSESVGLSYGHLSHPMSAMMVSDSYDHIARPDFSGPVRFQTQPSYGTLGQQLAHEPSVPNIPDGINDMPGAHRRKLTQQNSVQSANDPFVYTNAIYTPKTDLKPKPRDLTTSPPVSNGVKQKRSASVGPSRRTDQTPASPQFSDAIDYPSPSHSEHFDSTDTTPLISLDVEIGKNSKCNEEEDGKSLLSQNLESQSPLPYQNFSIDETVCLGNASTASSVPVRSPDSVRFVPAK